MDATDDLDEDELLAYDVQMSIQESCQKERLTGSGRYSNKNQLHNPYQSLACRSFLQMYFHLLVCTFRSEALKLVGAIKQGKLV